MSVDQIVCETVDLDSSFARPVDALKVNAKLGGDSSFPDMFHAGQSASAFSPNSFQPRSVSNFQYWAFGAGQIAWMFLLGVLFAAIGIEVIKWLFFAEGVGQIWYRALISANALFFGSSALMIAIKWLAIGRFKLGKIPVWSFNHFRFWIAKTAISGNPLNLFVGTPVYNIFLRLLGAKVGKGTLIFAPAPIATDLISIGDNTVIRQRSAFRGYTARNGQLVLGTVEIGSNAYLGEATVMDINSKLGDNSQLGNRSALHEGQAAGQGQKYWGSPAVIGESDFIRVPVENVSPLRAWLYTLGQYVFGAILAGPAIATAFFAMLKFYVTTESISSNSVLSGSAASSIALETLLAISLGLYAISIIVGILYVSIVPKIWNLFFRAGQTHKLFGLQYYFSQRILSSSNSRYLQLLFGDSSLIVPYFKAVGYDLKSLKQNGSNFGVEQRHHSPFLCAFSSNSFVSDGLFMINTDISRTSFKVSQITVPDNVYLGNDLHYPTGAKIGENCLVGTKALIPVDGQLRETVGVLGSPPFEIPRSIETDEKFERFKAADVLKQSLLRKLKSNLVTMALFMLRDWSLGFIALLGAMFVYVTYADVIFTSNLLGGAIFSIFGIVMLFFSTFYNILFGRITNFFRPVRPIKCSLYERPFWDQERYWKLNSDSIRDVVFSGTPFKNFWSRCQGVKIGKQVFDDGCGFSEPTLVTIGDYCTLNFQSTAQGHSLEDGIFKADKISIGSRSTLGIDAFIHYGTSLGDDTDIRTDAFVMKGSCVTDGETWTANPAAPIEPEQEFRFNR